MCFDQFREKQNREAPLSCDPRVEANPRSFVRRATAPRETAHLEENAREQSARSKKDKLTSRSKGGRDQTNARAEYIRTIPKHESGMTNQSSKYAYDRIFRSCIGGFLRASSFIRKFSGFHLFFVSIRLTSSPSICAPDSVSWDRLGE